MSRQRLREWILSTSGRIARHELRDDTALFENRIITSLQVMDLIVFVESLREKPLDVERLAPGSFRDIDTICRSFLEK